MPSMSADARPQTGIRYATTADGVRVAVRSEGDGQPVVQMPLVPWYGIRVAPQPRDSSTQIPETLRRAGRRVLQYDVRGMGLSEGEALDLSLHAQLLDLAAVINYAEAQRVSLLAPVHSAPAAIAYAEQHPDRISHLVVWRGYATGADFFGQTRVEAIIRILADDWELFTRNLALNNVGWDEPDAALALAALVRDSLTPQAAIAALRSLEAIDVAPILSRLRVPTLVVHRRGESAPPVETGRALAAGIPGARFLLLDGSAMAPFAVDSEAVEQVIVAFLSEELAVEPQARKAVPGESSERLRAPLTPRERAVLRLVAAGMSNDEIAAELIVASTTVKKHLHNASAKLRARNRTHAVARARELGVL